MLSWKLTLPRKELGRAAKIYDPDKIWVGETD